MELLNEWLPLIVTVLLSAITIGLVLIFQEIMENTDVCRQTNFLLSREEDPNKVYQDSMKVQKVEVVNEVPVVINNVNVSPLNMAEYIRIVRANGIEV